MGEKNRASQMCVRPMCTLCTCTCRSLLLRWKRQPLTDIFFEASLSPISLLSSVLCIYYLLKKKKKKGVLFKEMKQGQKRRINKRSPPQAAQYHGWCWAFKLCHHHCSQAVRPLSLPWRQEARVDSQHSEQGLSDGHVPFLRWRRTASPREGWRTLLHHVPL